MDYANMFRSDPDNIGLDCMTQFKSKLERINREAENLGKGKKGGDKH